MEKLEISAEKEYILAGDISSSMNEVDPKCGGNTKYNYMLEQFKSFIQTAQDFDKHGAPTVMLFGTDVYVYDHVTFDEISSKLNKITPNGWTNLHLLLDKAFDKHQEEKAEAKEEGHEYNGTQLFIFTDGAPTNKPSVERALINIVSNIKDEDEFQIHILTVGTIDKGLKEWLENLHDEMDNPKINPNDFDIIHVSALEDVTFLGAVAAKTHGALE